MRQMHGGALAATPSRARLCGFARAVFLLMLVTAAPARAHRAHAGLTEMAPATAGRILEITHRLYAHDLEPRLFHQVFNDWAQSPEGIARVGAYCRRHFALVMGGKALKLDYVGAEPDGEFIYIYFTTALPGAAGVLQVRDDLLDDVFDDQINLVNLTLKGRTQSRYFRYGDTPQAFDWPGAGHH